MFQLLALLASLLFATTTPSSYDALKREAEKFVVEKSFAHAHQLYEQASKLALSPADRRWVDFRLADTAWRMDDSNRDTTALVAIVNGAEHDRVWAEANESLADMTHGSNYYLAALDFWAGSDDIEYARRRYLSIFNHMTADQRSGYGYQVPREVLLNVIAIGNNGSDAMHARFMLAQLLLGQGRPDDLERANELLETVIAQGKKSEWYDDALNAAAWAASAGRVIANDEIDPRVNYERALTLYRRIVNEFAKGESQYRDDAERAIAEILSPSLNLAAAGNFLPDSEQEVGLMWRNVKHVELTIASVDLMTFQQKKNTQWMDTLRPDPKPLRKWTYETNDQGDHMPGNHNERIAPRLERGAYWMTATGGGKSAKLLLMVTDTHILLHSSPTQLQVYVSDVLRGEPIAGARVRVGQEYGDDNRVDEATTNADGIAVVKKIASYSSQAVIAVSAGKARQAWHAAYAYTYIPDREKWRIYAFTDRPAYRPGETVEWKVIARTRADEVFSTPAGQKIAWEIRSPRDEKIASGDATLNAYGSFSASLPLTDTMPLGAYNVTFKIASKDGEDIGSATLFRLEEYKLPEFRVSVTTPDKQLYRLGDTIEATIEASYYFGGPVANATVQAVIYQAPLYRYWYPWRKYPWYYEGRTDTSYGGQQMRTETLKTDANGRAVVRIETPRDGNDTRYRIEARVVDASRREVRGEGSVAVTRQRYSVMAQPEHYIHRPGEQVEIDFKATDANEQPVQTTGTVKIVRRAWVEKDHLYRDEDVTESKVTTNAKGEASFMFTAKATGYYAVKWTSEDRDPNRPLRPRDVVTAETTVWVADRATTDLSYYTNGLQLIVDKETLRAGETANVMIVSPASGRWVVVNATGDDILDTRVVHLDGTVKLVQMTVDARHEPSFSVTATSVFDRAIATDTETIVVPPVEQFIDVDVKSDRSEYQPRDEGTVTITTRDVNGKPVAAEVALAVSDEAVTAIQQDLAGDPREFFYGKEQRSVLQVSAEAQYQQYVRLVETKEKILYDDRYLDRLKERDQNAKDGENELRSYGYLAEGVVGGVVGGARDMASPPAPAPPPVAQSAMLDRITVAAEVPKLAKKQDGSNVEVEVRSDFRSTAFWKSDIVTDANGVAKIAFKYPEGLTTWQATARAASAGAQFGIGTSTSRTNMPLMVRLQAPRFFVAGDHSTVSAVINNNTDEVMRVEPKLEVEGLTLNMTTNEPVTVPARGEARADWTVVADRPGNAKLRVSGRGSKYGDAMEKSFTVYEHGIDKLIARSGRLRGDEALITLGLPRERRATDLVVQVAPSLAVTMLDALPYLVDYPYGCTEQTMSRFLPAAIVAKTLSQMGLDAKKRIPKLDDVTKASLARLYDFQHADGGWGWWKEDQSSVYMTSYVVWGFSIARDAGMKIDEARVERAFTWLNEHLVEGNEGGDWETDAWMIHAMSAWNNRPSKSSQDAFDDVWEHRERLTSYSRALLALTAHRYGAKDREAVLLRNLENGVKIDRTPDQSVLIKGGSSTAETMATAHWGQDRFWWHWHDGPIESTAFVLQALVAIDPKHKLVEPAMNWLVKNRRGAQWTNTRDTAITVLALNEYLRATGETVRDVTYEVTVNGKSIATKTVTAKQLLDAPSRFSVDPALLRDADQEIRIRANAPVYFSAEARFVSLEEPVKAAGNELFVKREYFRLAPKPTLLKGVVYDRIPLRDGDTVISGERVEVVDTIETKNDYEYLLFEDLKPAGFEAVELQSGQSLFATKKDGTSQWIYQELRDRKVAMFADQLTQGMWEIRYTLRAETPGEFHALPLLGHAMYAPDVRANGEETHVVVK
jgi:uncharacterized protein YfaS (alpha-2-macroglobulin family)